MVISLLIKGNEKILELVYANEEYSLEFEKTAAIIKQILGFEVKAIEHIGSSAVPNLLTKPISDVLVIVEEIDYVDTTNDVWKALRYEVKGESGIAYRCYFQKETSNPGVHIYVFDRFSKREIERHITFRDFLQTHPDVAQDYSLLKQQIFREACTLEQYQ
ncbi:MAG: GrpB family protein [Culicoidibacterales bacterium]